MKSKSTFLIFFALSCYFVSYSQNEKNPDQIIAPFLSKIRSERVTNAINVLSGSFNPTISSELEKKARKELQIIDSTFNCIDWFGISEMRLTAELLCKSYLLKYDNKPYRLDVLFYRKKNWVIQDFSIQEDLFGDLKNAGRAEKLRPNNAVSSY